MTDAVESAPPENWPIEDHKSGELWVVQNPQGERHGPWFRTRIRAVAEAWKCRSEELYIVVKASQKALEEINAKVETIIAETAKQKELIKTAIVMKERRENEIEALKDRLAKHAVRASSLGAMKEEAAKAWVRIGTLERECGELTRNKECLEEKIIDLTRDLNTARSEAMTLRDAHGYKCYFSWEPVPKRDDGE